MSDETWSAVDSKLREIGLDPRDIRSDLIPGFKEWLFRRGLKPSTVNKYIGAVASYIKRSSVDHCLNTLSAFSKLREYLEEVMRSDVERRLSRLTAELSASPPSKPRIRITKYNYIGYVRAKIIETLYEKGPMSVYQLSMELGISAPTLRSHLLALVSGGYVCDRLIDQGNPRLKMYAVCPSCPLKNECDLKKEMKWSGVQHG